MKSKKRKSFEEESFKIREQKKPRPKVKDKQQLKKDLKNFSEEEDFEDLSGLEDDFYDIWDEFDDYADLDN